jgi:hypothetical protein
MHMVLRSVGVLSVGKISGAIGVIIGLFMGAIVAMMSAAGIAMQNQGNGPPLPAVFFGLGAIVFIPLFYGVAMFVIGLIYGAVYNLIAGVVGGIEMEFERRHPIAPIT